MSVLDAVTDRTEGMMTTLTAQQIAKAIADATEIINRSRFDSDIKSVQTIFIPLMHAQRHIQSELSAMFAE